MTIIVPEDSVDLEEFKKSIAQEHENDVKRIEQYKEYYHAILKETGLPPSNFQPESEWELKKNDFEGVHCELLHKVGGTGHRVVYCFKGCAYVNYVTDSGRDMMQQFASITGVDAFCVDCGVAPEHTQSETLDDTIAGYFYLLRQGYLPENIIFAGDSSGGGTALLTALCIRNLKLPMPGGLILMSPFLDVTLQNESYSSRCSMDCMLGSAGLVEYARDFYYKSEDESFILPLESDLSGLPRTLIQVGTEERCFTDSEQLFEKLKENGIETYLEVYQGMFHEFQFYSELNSASVAWECMRCFLDKEDSYGKHK